MALSPEGLCALWRLRLAGPRIETPNSLIQTVEDGAGLALLKIPRPESDEQGAAGLLAWYAGAGSVRLLRCHGEAQLLEWIDGPPLSDLVRDGKDMEAAEVLAGVVRRLHASRPGPLPQLTPLAERFEPLTEPGSASDELHSEAARLAIRLLETTETVVPLHGDIHHDNILRHSARGWLAVDPKGLIGDPHYDLANALCNPLPYPQIVRDPVRVSALAPLFAEHLSLEPARLLAFAFCHACLAGIWCEEDGEDPTHWRAMASIFQEVRRPFPPVV